MVGIRGLGFRGVKQYMAWASKASFGPELDLLAAVHLEARDSYAFLKVGAEKRSVGVPY